MKYTTLKKKVKKWTPILTDILKKELVLPELYRIEVIYDDRTRRNRLGNAIIHERLIRLFYMNIEDYFNQNYPFYRKTFSNMHSDLLIPPRKEAYRTFIISILIHEMLHLSQYNPSDVSIRISDNIDRFIHPVKQFAVKNHRKKRLHLVEDSVVFQTVFIMYKYRKELCERLGINQYGFEQIDLLSLSLMEYAKKKNSDKVKANEKQKLLQIFTRICNKYTRKPYRYVKYKKASIIHIDALSYSFKKLYKKAYLEFEKTTDRVNFPNAWQYYIDCDKLPEYYKDYKNRRINLMHKYIIEERYMH